MSKTTMPIRTLPFDEIAATHILELRERAVREDRTLDFKRQINWDDDGKVEILKDVSAMANSAGGTIVYGVVEGEGDDSGVIVDLPGVQGASADDFHNRIDQLLQDGLDERIPGVLHRAIDRPQGGFYYVIRVPPSHLAPHMITRKTSKPRFYYRGTTTNQPMDARQIREVALRAEAAVDRATGTIRDRIAEAKRIAATRQTVQTLAGSRGGQDQALLHVVPLFPAPVAWDFSDETILERLRQVHPFGSSGRYGAEERFALEGFFREAPTSEDAFRRVVFLRNGAIEFQRYDILQEYEKRGDQPAVAYRFVADVVEDVVIEALNAIVPLVEAGLMALPAAIGLSLLGVGGSKLWPSGHYFGPPPGQPIRLDDVVIDPWLLHDFGPRLSRHLKQMFDVMWQAWGWQSSSNYGADGQRITSGKKR